MINKGQQFHDINTPCQSAQSDTGIDVDYENCEPTSEFQRTEKG